MSSFAEPTAQAQAAAGEATPLGMRKAGTGWITFCGVMLVLAGCLNLVDGLWALDVSDSAAISDEVEEMLWYSNSLETWGWIYTILGVALILVGVGIFSRNQIARWVGIGAASASMVVNMMWVFVYPIAALIHIFLAASVIYGLTAYGGDDGE